MLKCQNRAETWLPKQGVIEKKSNQILAFLLLGTKYFETLLYPVQQARDLLYASNKIEIHDLEMPLTREEIEIMLKKLSQGNPQELTLYPYDFFENSPEELLDELADMFTRFYNKGETKRSENTSIISPILKREIGKSQTSADK